MDINIRVIYPSEVDQILEFEKRKLSEIVSDPLERDLLSWKTRWTKESLTHYISMGWSFLIKETIYEEVPSEDKRLKDKIPTEESASLLGYFLAQPLSYFEGEPQSLWVEHIQFASLQIRDELCSLIYKLAKDKYFQKIYFPNITSIGNAIKHLKPEEWRPSVYCIKTLRGLE